MPSAWTAAEPRLAAEAAHQARLLESTPSSPQPPEALQAEMLRSYALGTAPFYGELEATCISYVRVHYLCLGGSALAPALYRLICRAVADPTFLPQVPRGSTSSCGNVVPAAHWTLALADFLGRSANYALRPAEGLALLNGAFIHVGLALAQLGPLEGAWQAFLLASRLNTRLCRARRCNYTTALADDSADPVRRMGALMHDVAASGDGARQDPFSVRAFPQIAGALGQALLEYLDALDQALARRSDNPLIVVGCDEPLSQGSFLAPALTLASSQVIEAILLAMWMTQRRTHYLLSGQGAGISAIDLGLGQVPPLMTALLEEARLRAGRRSFASGCAIMEGGADLCSFGVNTTEMLAEVLQRWSHHLAMELVTAELCVKAFLPAEADFRDVLNLLPQEGTLPQRFEAVRQLIAGQRLPGPAGWPFQA
jgi:histidine ammonia-lyase